MHYWFKYGLVLSALGMLREQKRQQATAEETNDEQESLDNENLGLITCACNGLAQVLIPIVRQLPRGPGE